MNQKVLSSLSIFFPAYYDEHTIGPLTRSCVDVAKELTDDFEIIIVDDKSPDKTGQVADQLAQEFKEVRVIHHPKNMGVGQAMITGYRNSKKDHIFYTDGDAQYDVKELLGFAPYAKDYDLVIGYRLKRAEGARRVFTSRVFPLLIFIFFGIHCKDIDCSFKLIHRRFLDRVQFHTNGGLVDAELLIQAKRLRVPVKEIGVHHYPRQYGKSQCLRVKLILSMLADMLRLGFKFG